jgi:hypothetical protein
MVDTYYKQQSQQPYFSGTSRQRGSGIGALVAGVGRIALPFFRNVILPTAKTIGRELLSQALPEALEVISKRKTPKQALKSTIRKTISKQIGRGRKRSSSSSSSRRKATTTTNRQAPPRRRRQQRRSQSRSSVSSRKRQRSASILSATPAKRSRLSFFSKVREDDY